MSEQPHGPETPEGPVVRDKRRLDPETGQVREPAATSAPADPAVDVPAGDVPAADVPPSAETAGEGDLERQLRERTEDLQRLQAEYANYRRRVERDRLAVADQALASVLLGMLPLLDDVDRARAHGELEGGFKVVGEALEATLTKLGLQRFGVAGEPFDPTVHEALMHSTSAEVTEPTAVEVLQPGYRIGERILRPARVAVADPE